MTDQTLAQQAADAFARRVRGLLDARRMSISDLAQRSELEPSLVSKLLTETDAVRRDPRLEHVLVIARALEVGPRELVAGTGAEALLGEWVPRAELEAESLARTQAQTDAAASRTELAGARGESATLTATVAQLTQQLVTSTRRLGEVEAANRREQMSLRIAKDAAEAKFLAALKERDLALECARENYFAWANARSQILQMQREVREAKSAVAITAIVSGIGGAILSAAASEPPPAAPSRRRASRSASG
jgi:transcriptional regulator with XRE-family HTH domain